MLHVGICGRGGSTLGQHGDGAGRRPAAGRPSVGPIRPPTCCTAPCSISSAATPCSRVRRSTPTCCDSTSPMPLRSTRRAWRRSRAWSTTRCSPQWPIGSRLLPLAEARHAGAMMLFGEKYPDVGPDGDDGRFQPRTLRRHACDEHRPDRPRADHGRGERVGRHAADHGGDRAAGARPHAAGRADARRGCRR